MKLKDAEQHEIDLACFLKVPTETIEDCMLRFVRTFGNKQQLKRTEAFINYLRLCRK